MHFVSILQIVTYKIILKCFFLSVPKIEGDDWKCQLFPNFQNEMSLSLGEEDFCGDAKHFPECDPQLPPTISFHKGETFLGKDYSNTLIIDSYDKLFSIHIT